MLIRLQEDGEAVGAFPSTIAAGLQRSGAHNGRREQTRAPLEHTPTSADIHMYADPASFDTRTPLLYADCEGFDGDENPPVGVFERRTSHLTQVSSMKRLNPGQIRRLAWADESMQRTRRAYIVKQLYPRFLYTLSDVVVFVIRDANSEYEASSSWAMSTHFSVGRLRLHPCSLC
jgi:hypothetical protein